MQQVVFIIACCVTISGGKINSVCKENIRLGSKVDILTEKLDRSLDILKKVIDQVKGK